MISFKQNFAATSKFGGFRPPIWPSAPLSPIASRRKAQRRRSPASRRSVLSPALADLAYALNRRYLLPTYFGQIQVTGQVHVPQSGAVIFAPTHRSRWDGLLLPYALGLPDKGRYPRYMVTIDEMQGLQGWFIRRLGGFPVDTRSPGVSSLRYGIELLHQAQPLVIFPEGGRLLENRCAGVNRLHPGLARIALKAHQTQPHCEIKIVPVAINYRDPRVGRCDVDIQIGAPLLVSHYVDAPAKRSASRMTEDLSGALARLSHLPTNVVTNMMTYESSRSI
jgi:1-acyl-sn-glycerol-3-phosphate acyltransferase